MFPSYVSKLTISEPIETQPSKAGSGCDSKSVEAYLDNELPARLLGIVSLSSHV